MKSNDYRNSFLIGIASSILWFFVLAHLSLLSESELIILVSLLPFLSVGAVAAAHVVFRSPVFHKFAKFLMVGMLNTGVDFFIFNTLIVATGTDKGLSLSIFKSISFIGAMANSYALNRSWTFGDEADPSRKKNEFARFALITIIGFLINVGLTSFIANAMAVPFHLSQIRWDNVAAIVATAVNLIWNFIGYKLFVFKPGKARVSPTATIPDIL